jgi:hypothetical protein
MHSTSGGGSEWSFEFNLSGRSPSSHCRRLVGRTRLRNRRYRISALGASSYIPSRAHVG